MNRWEYLVEIIAKERLKELIYFCQPNGECTPQQVAVDQVKALGEILNLRGREGWRLSQMTFGANGILVVWMRKLKQREDK